MYLPTRDTSGVLLGGQAMLDRTSHEVPCLTALDHSGIVYPSVHTTAVLMD